MTDGEELNKLAIKPEDTAVVKTSLTRTLVSLALFIYLYYLIFNSWQSVLFLVTVLVIHESGHFIAMKYFGYKSVNMTFVPFVGAYVSGEATNLSKRNKLIVLLAGPVPGIIIGCVLFYLNQLYPASMYLQLATPFLILNLFNLLPIYPLDGGQFLQIIYFNGSRILQLGFLYLSIAVLIFLFFKLNYSWWLLLIAVLVFLRIGKYNLINKIRKQLDEDGINYACTYDDLTDEEYWHIRNVVITSSKTLSRKYSTYEQSGSELDIIKYIEAVLTPAYNDDLTVASKLVFTLVWVVSILVPLLIWSFYQGYL